MDKTKREEVLLQKSQVFDCDFRVTLDSACTLGYGIICVDDKAKIRANEAFNKLEVTPSFFIPASGSGSRMFNFLYKWLEDGEDSDMVSAFFNQFDLFPFASRVKTRNHRANIVNELLSESELNYGEIPKGLIPFHIEDGQLYSAFQEHVRQAKSFLKNDVKIHFTIQKDFEKRIIQNIEEVNEGVDCTFSYQGADSSAFCFDHNKDLVMHGDDCLKRPAGHGAILSNLNEIDSDLILIKNIDNIQHNSKAALTEEVWKMSIGMLKNFQEDLKSLSKSYSIAGLISLNLKYQFLPEEEVEEFDAFKFDLLMNRPTRVCGMVENEGAPGGGPFWVKNKNSLTKQIVEGFQISKKNHQKEIVQSSSHFNPVFLVVCKTDIQGNRLDLMRFRDEETCFVVDKKYKDISIKYRELPGLWNGGMSDWNTIFIEVPSAVFSPVKTVLGLNNPAHNG